MYIQSINNCNSNFEGSYKLKGTWTKKMRDAAVPFLEELAKGDKEIVANMTTKRTFFDGHHRFGQKVYKLKIAAFKEGRSLWDKIKEKFGYGDEVETQVSEYYHRKSVTEKFLPERLSTDSYNIRNYFRRLNIKDVNK